MKANDLWPVPRALPSYLETHSTPPHRSANNGDICERYFLTTNVLKNVFPPPLTFHITSAAPLLTALSLQKKTKKKQQNRLGWGSTCTAVKRWSAQTVSWQGEASLTTSDAAGCKAFKGSRWESENLSQRVLSWFVSKVNACESVYQ